jgi:4-diphosphocytidyl-2-C-methyl-D-erythritol kinase
MLTESAPAKINLFLRLTGKRADGYHEMQSLMAFTELGDALAVEPAEALSLAVTGPVAADVPRDAGNLILKAATRLDASRGAALRLEKNLPVAAGLGGGSADAAAALRLLARLWNVDIPAGLALQLGSDVPACLASRSLFASGRGEVCEAVSLPRVPVLLVNPGVAVSTASVFAARQGEFSAPLAPVLRFADARALVEWLAPLGNDLAAPALSLAPAIGEVQRAIRAQPGCLLARMSGSGATYFGIFETMAASAAAASAMPAQWWSRACHIGGEA